MHLTMLIAHPYASVVGGIESGAAPSFVSLGAQSAEQSGRVETSVGAATPDRTEARCDALSSCVKLKS